MGTWVVGPQSITAMVLAGGRSLRWGGQDKGLIKVDQTPMALSVMQRLQMQGHEALAGMAINANRHLPDYAAWGWPVWPDEDPLAFNGPLAGWQAGLRRCPTPWLLSAPCDSPHCPMDLLSRLVQRQGETGTPLVIAASREGSVIRPHPVFALLHTDLLPDLDTFIQAGGRRAWTWCQTQAHSWAIFDKVDGPDPFANINSADDAVQHRTRLTSA
jgi:molybdopterin-guanine dinucleotide biosynthesis protein A